MDISVVVCTKNRPTDLCRCLHAIFDIEFDGEWEIIVVDNGSADETADLLYTLSPLSPVPFRVLFETQPGNSAGRNAAIPLAAGELLFFTDDDCLVEPEVLQEMWQIFRDERMGFAGGRIRLFNPQDYPVGIMEVAEHIDIPPGTLVYPGLVQGSNMAFRRKLLVDLGGFDPEFGAGASFAGEELELATRASMQGWHGGYFPGPTVAHNHGRKRASALRSEMQYDIGIGAYYSKFLLDATTRKRCALVWARRSVKQLFRHPRGLPRQVAGAVRYLRLHNGEQEAPHS
ncbi:MAG: glycosyltransferase [Rhodocyclaceae bacterium]